MKNVKITTKFLLIILPLLVLVMVSAALLYKQSLDVFNATKSTFFDQIALSSSEIINADRDFYQAAYAEQELGLSLDLTEEEQAALVADHEENAQQTYDRIYGAIEKIKDNSELYDSYRLSSSNVTLKELYADFCSNFELWDNSYDNSTQSGDMDKHLDYFSDTRDNINQMEELLEEYGEYYGTSYSEQLSTSTIRTCLLIFVIALLLGIFSMVVAGSLGKGIKHITGVSKRLASGDFSAEVDSNLISKDELGQLCAATANVVIRLRAYVGYISETVESLQKIQDGHLWVNLKQDFTGEFEVIKYALFGLSEKLNETLTSVAGTAELIDSGSGVLSTAAQTLAQGATEQASSVQELSASIEDISAQVQKNAENAEKAKLLSAETSQIMEISVEEMDQAKRAMDEISETSMNIGKVIKTIDDIAFQTNILALNAAVEAARAGAAGKGFAVVADEVRNLSQKSAEAAKNTAALIESSIEAVKKGVGLVDKTSSDFSAVAARAFEVGKLVESISDHAKEQAAAISQVSTGIEQISTVVQTNSAVAEENAASSEELSAHAAALKGSVMYFELFTKPEE